MYNSFINLPRRFLASNNHVTVRKLQLAYRQRFRLQSVNDSRFLAGEYHLIMTSYLVGLVDNRAISSGSQIQMVF